MPDTKVSLPRDVRGKVAVITGAASGIGEATAKAFADLGITVIGADVDDARGATTFAALGAPHSYRHLDVGSSDEWGALIADVTREFGGVDIVHLNAGVMTRPKTAPLMDDPLAWFTESGFTKVMTVNLKGVALGIIAALESPTLSHIIVTASGAALTPLAMDPLYTMSKYGVLGMCLALEESLAERGVRIDVICPGAIGTAITPPDIQAAVKQESPAFLGNAVAELVTTADHGPVWTAFTEAEGLRRYDVPGGPVSATV
ncbi:SDR family oxidoreductase [Nocardia sp. NPDC050378]|uniref:SDR family oxidoreductase n=1 Tax=Nocardia sp. NPDC050378 TaxID=3155400 RepID=UPI0033E34CD4